jgi:CheY-like chemotaxis protein
MESFRDSRLSYLEMWEMPSLGKKVRMRGNRTPNDMVAPKTPGRRLRFVLLAAAEDNARHMVKWTLTDYGYLVDVTRTAEEALSLFDATIHDAVVTTDTLPGISGNELAHIIKLRSPGTPVVLLASRPVPQDRSCLDAVIDQGTRVSGLLSALRELLADAQTAEPLSERIEDG